MAAWDPQAECGRQTEALSAVSQACDASPPRLPLSLVTSLNGGLYAAPRPVVRNYRTVRYRFVRRTSRPSPDLRIRPMNRVAARLAALTAALALASCSIPPKPDAPALRNEAPLAGIGVAHGGQWPEAQWWKRYGDDQLDTLERKALDAAPTLDEARKRFGTALRSIDIARAAGGASVQANAQVQRLRMSENGLIPSQFLGFTWYNQGDLSLQFQYDFDFWGKTRSAVAAAVDEARAAEAERSAAALMLTTAVADTYFAWQADQARLALARESVAALERSRLLTEKRAARGIDTPDLVHQADARLAGARELEAAYAGSAPIRLAALAALLGVAPAELPALAARPLPAVETKLPDDVGLDLLARRPDIAANRWRVEAAMRRVEQARAEFYPDISLGAMVGLSSIDLDKLSNASSRTFGVGPALHLPLFALSRLNAQYGASRRRNSRRRPRRTTAASSTPPATRRHAGAEPAPDRRAPARARTPGRRDARAAAHGDGARAARPRRRSQPAHRANRPAAAARRRRDPGGRRDLGRDRADQGARRRLSRRRGDPDFRFRRGRA